MKILFSYTYKYMIRKSSHTLKYANDNKLKLLLQLYNDFQSDLQSYVDLICDRKLPIKNLLSSKLLPTIRINHSRWKQIIYKQASEIVRSNIQQLKTKKYKRYKKCYSYFKRNGRLINFTNKKWKELNLNQIFPNKIEIKNISINIDERLVNFTYTSKYFDEFANITLPYFQPNKHRAITIKIPIKYHKQSLLYKDWSRRKTVQLKKINDKLFLTFFYEKEPIELKSNGGVIAFDIGYNKLLADNNCVYYGTHIKLIINKIQNKQNGSKNQQQHIIYRNNEINKTINDIDFSNIKEICIEDLKNIPKKGKLQSWVYPKVLDKIQNICEESGIKLTLVNPAYTSQTCSRCGTILKENRQGELYKCNSCGLEIDADYNAAINILRRGVYNPSSTKKQIL